MRVAVLTALFPVRSEIPFLNQIVGLVERGHQVDIYADGPQPGGPFHPDVERLGLQALTHYPIRWPADRLERWRAASRTVLAHRGEERRALLRSLDPTRFWHRAWTLDQLRRTARFLPRRPHDVAYCAFGMDAPHAVRLRSLGVLSGQLVVAFRGADTTKYVARRGPRVYARTFREARLLLPVCDFLGRRLIALGAPSERVQVHRTGIDLARWPYRERRAERPGRLRLVTVGRLVEKKGVEFVLRAVRHPGGSGRGRRVPRPRRWAPARRARGPGRGAGARGSGDARGATRPGGPYARRSRPRMSWSRRA